MNARLAAPAACAQPSASRPSRLVSRRASRLVCRAAGALEAGPLSPFVASKLEAAERTHKELSFRLADPEARGAAAAPRARLRSRAPSRLRGT